MDLATVSALYHAGGGMVPIRLVYLLAGLLLVLGVRGRLAARPRWRAGARLAQWTVAGAGLLLSSWLIAVEVAVFEARCAACLAASAALAAAFALGLRAPGWRPAGAIVVLAAAGLGYLLPFGTIPKVFVLAEPASHPADGTAPRERGHGRLLVQEFADFQCPACARMDESVERLVAGRAGQVRYVYRHLPLTSIHPRAERAAVASECAARQGKFREVKRMLFSRQTQLGGLLDDLDDPAWSVADRPAFRACVERGETAAVVRQDVAAARRLRLRSTPSVLIGQTLVVGAAAPSRLEAVLDHARRPGLPAAEPVAAVAAGPGCNDDPAIAGCSPE